jgi:hypothetical protein
MTAREFKVGEHVLSKVNPKKRSLKLGNCTKLATRFYGPFEILDIIGPVSYMFALSASMNLYNLFYFSLLKKYVQDPNDVIDWNLTQIEPKGDLQVQSMCILGRKVKVLQNQAIGLVKVQWTRYGPEDATWEHEDAMQKEYP